MKYHSYDSQLIYTMHLLLPDLKKFNLFQFYIFYAVYVWKN